MGCFFGGPVTKHSFLTQGQLASGIPGLSTGFSYIDGGGAKLKTALLSGGVAHLVKTEGKVLVHGWLLL